MFYISLYLAKLTNLIINTLKLGAGFTWPGHVALTVYPNLFKNKKVQLPHGFVLISGTNGKTTTSKLISHIFSDSGYKVLTNKSGANLLNGVASVLLLDRDLLGRTKSDIGIFEVDEFTLPLILKTFTPRVLVLLNLSRDQLDRYGEIDIILDRWQESLQKLSGRTSLVLDHTQKKFESLVDAFKGHVFYFDNDDDYLNKTKLVGDFNARNINASFIVATTLGLEKNRILSSLAHFDAAYGRGELIDYRGKSFQLFLAKNPISFNNNLDIVLEKTVAPDSLLFVLNDEVRDGRDVSWIYDIKASKLKEACVGKKVFVSGDRCLDFAVRLSYVGVEVDEDNINDKLERILNKMAGDTEVNEALVFPNYSAMLQTREIILGRSIL